MTYQKPDEAYINYKVYRWGRLEQIFRGPPADLSKPYVACLGSAQTFGRYVRDPFPSLVASALGVEVANFGTGGAGPGLFLRDSALMEAASNAKVCVIQVMSARSLSNRLFRVKANRNAQIDAVSKALEDLFPHVDFDTFTYAHNMLNKMAETDPDKFLDVEEEMRAAWTARTRTLLQSIEAPKILFWLSERSPDDQHEAETGQPELKYPQFVDREMIEAVSPFADAYVECVSSAGLPQSLLVGGQAVLQTPYGAPVTENRYYPSPEMHALAARMLSPVISDFMGGDMPTLDLSRGNEFLI